MLAHHFESIEQQNEAETFGMWVFLTTEVLFFGGLFACYAVYRFVYPLVFSAASRQLDMVLGGVNTAVLLVSSLTMALAVSHAFEGRTRTSGWYLAATAVLGVLFLAIKAFEYREKFVHHHYPGPGFSFTGADPRQAQLFFGLYFVMTGVHALHLAIGIAIVAYLALLSLRNRGPRPMGVELTGLYWHFVDLVWVFLYPLLYLVDRSQ